jgi:hypothetical protein
MDTPSARLRQAYSNAWRHRQKVLASTCTVPVHRIGCSAVQSALSPPISLALSLFSFVLSSSWSDKSKFFKVKTAFRVKYLVPGNFGPNAVLCLEIKAEIDSLPRHGRHKALRRWPLRDFA